MLNFNTLYKYTVYVLVAMVMKITYSGHTPLNSTIIAVIYGKTV